MRVHFLGIGGSGTSAVAAIAQAQGFEVSGCDKDIHSEFTGEFKKEQLFENHSPNHLKNIDILAISPAVLSLNPNNPEVKQAKKLKIPLMTWQEFMGKYLEKDKFLIAVCGTHGKSTTTAMIGRILEDSGLDPTVELGAIVNRWGKNFRIGLSKYFVTEADEFNDNFLVTKPDIAIITNLEMDHPEYFADFESYKLSFVNFLSQTKQTILANLQEPNVAEVLNRVMKQTEVSALDFTKTEPNLKLKILGNFNKLNAMAAFQLGLMLGLSPDKMKQTLENFKGVGRRLEFLGKYKGAQVFSDFGHHPTEVEVTLQALREQFPDKQLDIVFQPHMFSRTKALFDDFVRVFTYAPVDEVYITDIYPSREVDTGLVSSQQLVDVINKHRKSAQYVSRDQLNYLKDHSELISDNLSNLVILYLGAGDIDQFARKLVKET